MQRWTVHFAGHVQGVGFRLAVRSIAQRFAVAGFVENLDDGRVKLVAEGEPEELIAFVESIQQRMIDYVRQTRTDRSQPNGEFGPAAAGSLTIR